MTQDALTTAQARIAALPLWRGRPTLEPLHGGLSNVSFLASHGGDKYVVRLTRDFPFHGVVRDREVAVARAAHRAGFAPEVVHAEPGLMVSRFLNARALDAEALRHDIDRIVGLLGRFHTEMAAHAPWTDYAFDVFEVNRDYLDQLGSSADRWREVNERLTTMQVPMPRVFGHHDLLPGNWLDDGSRLWLIDFEYAGTGNPLFDLANLSSHGYFEAGHSRALLASYFGKTPDADLLRAHRAMEAASLLREALWSLVSEQHIRERNVDYAGYAELNFGRLREAVTRL